MCTERKATGEYVLACFLLATMQSNSLTWTQSVVVPLRPIVLTERKQSAVVLFHLSILTDRDTVCGSSIPFNRSY